MFKFYNPFKPHIVKDGNGEYWVRKNFWCSWLWLSEGIWWQMQYNAKSFPTFDDAQDNLKKGNYFEKQWEVNRQRARNVRKVVYASED